MFILNRREFGAVMVVLGTRSANLLGAVNLDETLRDALGPVRH